MRILAIDTTSHRGSVALTQDQSVIAKIGLFTEKDHSVRLLLLIDFMLKNVGISLAQLDAIAVNSGPGSFTGIRIGLATAKGLADTLGKPVIPIVALEALAHRVRSFEGLICPMIDAQRDQIFTCLYLEKQGRLQLKVKDTVTKPADWIESLPKRKIYFLGDGAERYAELIGSRNQRNWGLVKSDLFLADAIAELGFEKIAQGVQFQGPNIDGYYIRPSDAEVSKSRRS